MVESAFENIHGEDTGDLSVAANAAGSRTPRLHGLSDRLPHSFANPRRSAGLLASPASAAEVGTIQTDDLSERGPLGRSSRSAAQAPGRALRVIPEPAGRRGLDPCLDEAFERLEGGLRADLRLVKAAEQSRRPPQWAATQVLRTLPERFRPRYDSRFVTNLIHAAAALRRDWTQGRPAPDYLAGFVLAVWVLDEAAYVAQCRGGSGRAMRRSLAVELGLAAAGPHTTRPAAAADAWEDGWSLDAIRVQPDGWFDPCIRTLPGEPGRERRPGSARSGAKGTGGPGSRPERPHLVATQVEERPVWLVPGLPAGEAAPARGSRSRGRAAAARTGAGLARTWADLDGLRLPVVDVTDPAFDLEVTAADLPALGETSLQRMEKLARLPGPMRTLLRRSLVRNSVLLGGRARTGAVMTGMTTYLNKLGPDNLDAAWAGKYDDDVARMIPSVALRLRLRSVAELLAAHLADALPTAGERVHLLNIGGGTASDSLNALLLLEAARPGALAGREVVVHVLDLDETGPRFAAECARQLSAPGAPLAGVAVKVDAVRYDWADASRLADLVRGWGPDLAGGSSEGALFEYGADAEITANLRALGEVVGSGFALVGSLWRDNRLTRAMQASNPLSFHLRQPDGFASLVASVGWTVAETREDNPVYSVVSLLR